MKAEAATASLCMYVIGTDGGADGMATKVTLLSSTVSVFFNHKVTDGKTRHRQIQELNLDLIANLVL